ncbi:MAG: hypothetical protein KF812_10225 [Fimbriimonadaceae bacterium]|nr:hypothetical protein [Fimbriimonadaceae bacterium]
MNDLVTVQAGSTATIVARATWIAETNQVTATTTRPTNMVVTPTPSNFVLSQANPTQDISIEIRVNGSVPPGDYTFDLRVRDLANRAAVRTITIRVTNTTFATGITKLTDFTPGPDGVWVSRFRIDNGAPGALFGSLSFPPFDLGYRMWYRPDGRLVLGEGQSREFEVVAALRDTTEAEGNTDITVSFDKGGNTFSFMSGIAYTNPAGRSYRLHAVDQTMRPLLVQGDNQAEFTFDLNPDAGIMGTYTVSIQDVDPSVTATVTPASIVLDGSGSMVTFTITFNRVSDDTDHIDDQPYEPLLVGTNSVGTEANIRQRFFIDVPE